MKKNLLCILSLAAAMSVSAQTVVFEDDFEWLAPWAEAGNNKEGDEHNPAGNTIGTNNSDAYCPQLGTPKVVVDEAEVTAYQALQAKGYSFTAYRHPDKSDRKPQAQTYLQTNYIKFGLTGYQTAITLPAIDVPAANNVTIAFDWCSQRQGSGTWDNTQLVVVVKNGNEEVQVLVPTHEFEANSEYVWVPVTVELGDLVTKESTITIRNIDEQLESDKAYRYYLDNIKVTASPANAVAEIEDAAAPVEFFNLQGIKVNNPENGTFIRRQGNKVQKVLVK